VDRASNGPPWVPGRSTYFRHDFHAFRFGWSLEARGRVTAMR